MGTCEAVSVYRRSLEEVLEALVVHSPTSYSWFGRRVDDLDDETVAAMDAGTAEAYITDTMQWQLYSDYYCRGAASPMPVSEPPVLLPRWTPFLGRLSAANAGHGSSEPGWTVHGEDGSRLVVERDGLKVWVGHDDVRTEGGAEPTSGVAVRVRLPNELRKLSPGFYMALGDEGIGAEASEPLVRLYWNLRPDGASQLIRRATAALNAEGVPFQMKVVNDPESYDRCDAGVIYVRRVDYPLVRPLVELVYRDAAADLEPATPAFTKRLAPGLGLAEDPGGGVSFGTHRCRLLAEGILRAHRRGFVTAADRSAAVEVRFLEEGLDLDDPYRSPGSVGVYDFDVR